MCSAFWKASFPSLNQVLSLLHFSLGPLASPPSPTRCHWVDQKNHCYLLLTVHLGRRKSLLSHGSSKSCVDDLCAVMSSPCSFPLVHLSLSLRKKLGGRESRITTPPSCVLQGYTSALVWGYDIILFLVGMQFLIRGLPADLLLLAVLVRPVPHARAVPLSSLQWVQQQTFVLLSHILLEWYQKLLT